MCNLETSKSIHSPLLRRRSGRARGVAELAGAFDRNVDEEHAALQQLLLEPLKMTPKDGRYIITGRTTFGNLSLQNKATPTGFEPVSLP